jgi:hypothetical protein
MKVKWNIKGILYGLIALALVVGGFVFIPKMFFNEAKAVEYTIVQRDAIPEKILDVMGKYADEERALAIKTDDKIYVVATRGKDINQGIQIEKIQMAKDEGKDVMKVNIVYKNKDDAHPYIVVETDLKDLPDRIELNTDLQDDTNKK